MIRQQLHEYIDQVSDKKLEGLYMFVEDEIQNSKVYLTQEQIDFLNEEREQYLKGEGESYTWEEAKEIIRSRKKI